MMTNQFRNKTLKKPIKKQQQTNKQKNKHFAHGYQLLLNPFSFWLSEICLFVWFLNVLVNY